MWYQEGILKKNYLILSLFILLSLLLSSCANSKATTISINEDSEYVHTFKDLNLGVLADFDFKLNDADKAWVDVWVEKYKAGKRVPEPLAELSYGLSPNDIEEGNLGFGMLNLDTDEPLVFLYGPNVKIDPQKTEKLLSSNVFSGWDYAMGEEKVQLEWGKTYLLGAYRVSKGSSITTYDLQDEEEVKNMIQDDRIDLLLKIKIEEK